MLTGLTNGLMNGLILLFPEEIKIFRDYVVVLSKEGKVSKPFDWGKGKVSQKGLK